MGFETGFQIGKGVVEIVSDDTGLRGQVRESVRAAGAGQHIDVPVRADTRTFFRDVNGRLHDEEGKFVAEGRIMGDRFGDSFGSTLKKKMNASFMDFFGALNFPLPGQIIAVTGAIAALSPVVLGLASSLGMAAASGTALLPAMFGLVGVAGIIMGAFSGASGALKAHSASLKATGAASQAAWDAYGEAMGKLDPATRQFVTTLVGFQKELQGTQKIAAATFLPGVTVFLLQAQKLLPDVNVAVRDIGMSLRVAAIEAGALISTPLFREQLSTIMERNDSLVRSLALSVFALGSAFMSVTTSASSLLPRLGEAVERGSSALAQWIEMKRVSGELDAFFQRAGDSMATWFNIVANLVIGIVNILRAANPAGEQMAGNLEEITKRFRDWTGSTEGQSRMRGFFEFIMNIDYGKIIQTAGALMAMAAAIKVIAGTQAAVGVVQGIVALGPVGITLLVVAGAIVAAAGAMAWLARESGTVRGYLSDIGQSAAANLLPPLRQLWSFIQTNLVPILKSAFVATLREVSQFLSEHLFPALKQAAENYLPMLESAWNRLVGAFKSNKTELSTLFNWLKTLATFLADNVVPALGFVAGVMSTIFLGEISIAIRIVGWLVDAVHAVGAAFTWVGNAAVTVWNAAVAFLSGVFTWLVNAVMGVYNTVTSAFQWIWDKVTLVFNGIWAAISFALNIITQLFVIAFTWIDQVTGGALSGIYNGIVSFLTMAKDFVIWVMSMLVSGWQAAWGWVSSIAAAAWDWVVSKAMGAADWVFNKVSWLAAMVVGFFEGLGSGVRSAWNSVWTWVSDTARSWIDKVSGFVGGMKDGIVNTFRSLPRAIVSATNALIDIVNNMIGRVNNILPNVLKLPELGHVTIPQGFARGGPIHGPGTGTSDSVPIMASDGEYMLRSRAVRALQGAYGSGFLDWLNHYDVAGDPGLLRLRPKRYADGGLISRTQDWIRAQDPKPYVFGAAGPDAWDCSSLVGGVWALLTGREPARRYFLTYDLPGAGGFVPGRGAFTIGLSREHVVGNLAGLAFEAANSQDGILVGSGATSVDRMPAQYYLPQVGGSFIPAGSGVAGLSIAALVGRVIDGLVGSLRGRLPRGNGIMDNVVAGVFDATVGGLKKRSFDQGGPLYPGLPVIAHNTTGRVEQVLDPDQTEAWQRGGGASYHFAPGSIVLDASKIKSVQDLIELIESLRRTARQFGAVV